MRAPERYVFVSLANCGHAQSVYVDIPQQMTNDEWSEAIMGDLRAGLIVKRVRLKTYQEQYAKLFLCGCENFSTGDPAA